MSSVLVLVVLVGLWGLVLVPAFRQRHDRLDELRSVDRFSSALRVLSRRGAGTPDRRWVVMPPRAGGAAPASTSARTPSRTPARPASRAASSPSPAERRRRTLSVLGGVVVLTLALVVLRGTGWLPPQLVADAALVGVLVWCARSARRERERRLRTARRARVAARTMARAQAEAAPAWSPARERPAAAARELPLTTVALGERYVDAEAPPSGARAVPAPRRTATAVAEVVLLEAPFLDEPFIAEPASGVRLLDLTTPGVWQRERLFADTGGGGDDAPESIDLTDDAGLEALLERRTAAGGW